MNIPLMEQLRGTGRTTRMVQKAVVLSKEGHAVYIIAATSAHKKRLEEMLPKPTSIKVEVADNLDRFEWDLLRVRGMHPNCEVLIDHHAIESRFWRILKELHAYDPA